MEIAQARPRRRRHPRMAHPVTRAAKERARRPAAWACRCPDAPCRLHPFAFDYERLLAGKAW